MEREADLTQAHHIFDLKYRLGDLRASSVEGATLLRLADGPTLITAPHSVTQVRAGREKPAEFWTGAIAETLGITLKASVLTALSPRVEVENAASSDPFLQTLIVTLRARAIRLVFDVHGLSGTHGLDINVGSAGFREPNLVDDLAKDLTACFSVALGKPYNGGGSITSLINRSTDIDAGAIQLELGPRLRSDTTNSSDLWTLTAVLRRFEEAFLRVR